MLSFLHLVVFGKGHDVDDGLDAVEAVEPLLPLRPLPADVDHVDPHAPVEAQK